MKGIIAEITGKYAVVLTQNGIFKKIKSTPDMAVGKEIDLNRPSGKVKNTRLIAKAASIAAAALLALGGGAYSYTVPYSYVHVDINPSVELAVNIYDRIIKAEALNEEGKILVNKSGLNHSRLDAGVSKLLNKAVECGYLKSMDDSPDTGASGDGETNGIAGNAILITISSTNPGKLDELKKEIVDTASKELSKENINSEIIIGEASIKQRNAAMELGITPGKLVLLEDAVEGKPYLDIADFKETSVNELIEKVKTKMLDADKAGNGNSKEESGKERHIKDEQPGNADNRPGDRNGNEGKSGTGMQNNADDGNKKARNGHSGLENDKGYNNDRSQNKNQDSEIRESGKSGEAGKDSRNGRDSESGNGIKNGNKSHNNIRNDSKNGNNSNTSNNSDDGDNKKSGGNGTNGKNRNAAKSIIERYGDELKEEKKQLKEELLDQIKKIGQTDKRQTGNKDPKFDRLEENRDRLEENQARDGKNDDENRNMKNYDRGKSGNQRRN